MNNSENQPETWEQYHRTLAGIAAQLLGTGNYFEQNPDHASDAELAAALRRYVRKIRDVEMPRNGYRHRDLDPS